MQEPPSPASRLPVDAVADRIATCVEENRVTLICGPTGCGKSTRVPQLVAKALGGNVLCTMPRRLAATAAAQRLADMQQPAVEVGGAEVGFHVGADKRCTEQTRLVFATAGVLVEMLRAGGESGLDRFAALIVDEVHERSVENDLSLALVRQLMLKRSRLRLILMSATFDLPRYEAFLGAKLGSVARVNIPDAQPGSMEIFHRCSTEYLEGVLRLPSLDGHADVTRLSETSNGQPGNIHLEPTLHLLIRDLVLHCHNQVCRSAAEIILVFLPTFRSLEHQFDLLQMSGAALNVRALHSAIDLETSALTMLTGGEGRRKVILATNVAESSVTIPGVTCVIDSCRTLQVVWSRLAQKDVPTIAWISKSQADQRKGRTGRTCAGTVYRLVPRSRYDSFATYEPPAVRMQSLRETTLVLSCSASSSMSDPMSLFATCLDPPDRTVVSDALTYLAHIDAIEVASNGRPRPTFLGRLLTSMPLALTAARLAVLGGREGLMRDAAALASVLDKSPLPIIQPFGDQLSCVANLQMYFTQAKQSDRVSVLLANLAAFEFWQHARRDPARLAALCAHARLAPDAAPVAPVLDVAAEEAFCTAHRLSLTALLQVEQTLNAIVNAFHRWRPAFLDDVALPACAVTQMDHACSPGGLCALSVPQFTDAFPDSAGSELEAILCAIVEEDVEPVLAVPINYAPLRTVCLFYNKPGGCTRTGCTFLHAAGPPPPCRFYGTKQGCSFGARCTFWHDPAKAPMGVQMQARAMRVCSADLVAPAVSTTPPPLNALLSLPPRAEEHVVLILGDADFALAESLRPLTSASIIACTPRSRQDVDPSRVEALEAPSALLPPLTLLFGVDPTRLDRVKAHIPWESVHTVLCNHPSFEGGALEEDHRHQRRMLGALFTSLAVPLLLLAPGAQLLLTLRSSEASNWALEAVARDSFLFCTASWAFDEKLFPGYMPGDASETSTTFCLEAVSDGLSDTQLEELEDAYYAPR